MEGHGRRSHFHSLYLTNSSARLSKEDNHPSHHSPHPSLCHLLCHLRKIEVWEQLWEQHWEKWWELRWDRVLEQHFYPKDPLHYLHV